MTEAELVDAIQGSMAVIHSNREFALTILTGYLLIIHFVGESLTRFQVSFVTTVYSLFYIHRCLENYGTGEIKTNYLHLLHEQYPEFAEKLNMSPHAGLTNGIALLLAFLIFVGSILFMWSVRNSRTA